MKNCAFLLAVPAATPADCLLGTKLISVHKLPDLCLDLLYRLPLLYQHMMKIKFGWLVICHFKLKPNVLLAKASLPTDLLNEMSKRS